MSQFKSGYILHRKRKIPVVWNGEHAQHIAEEHIKNKGSHPLLHVRIQQLAKRVKEWKPVVKGSRRHTSKVTDKESNSVFLIVVEIWPKFVFIITCYKR